ncbi:MAG TPA: hypothetical protein VIU12_25120 [Chryseolinea sp.]
MPRPNIPIQKEGGQFDVSYSATASTPEEAHRVFMTAADRLLSVNDWKKISGTLSSDFALMDAQGKHVDRKACVNDYFKIDIPAPGPAAGDGSDWVHIQAIQDQREARGNSEIVSILVHPSPAPGQRGEDVAHFLDPEASSSFVVMREDRVVTAAVHSRNEKPNVKSVSLTDKVRNAVISAGAFLGFSRLQWQALLKGLFDNLGVEEHKV